MTIIIKKLIDRLFKTNLYAKLILIENMPRFIEASTEFVNDLLKDRQVSIVNTLTAAFTN